MTTFKRFQAVGRGNSVLPSWLVQAGFDHSEYQEIFWPVCGDITNCKV
jgi:hypothetical protein